MAKLSVFVPLRFFARPAHEVAPDLVGRDLVVRQGAGTIRAMILETEAYGGPEDPASHAAFRAGGRARAMWDDPGTIYVYAAYGMYPCLNIVTGQRGEAGAVLIRGIWLANQQTTVSGPGRTARVLGVTLDDQGRRCDGERVGVGVERVELVIEQMARVGITRGVETPWRFAGRRESASADDV